MAVGKTEVDHPPDRDRHDQGRAGGDDQRDERGGDLAAMSKRIGQQRPEGAQRDAGAASAPR